MLESVIRTVPLLVLIGFCASMRWLKLCGTGVRAGDLVGARAVPAPVPGRCRARSGRACGQKRGRHAEILGQHLGRRVLEPVAEQEGVVLVEVAVVEHQQELAAVGTEALDRMRDAGGKIPEIADADVVDEVAALRVDRGDARGAVEHVGPLGLLVPMQLAHAAGIEPHVDAGDVLGNAELAHRHLPGPAAAFLPHMGVGEREAQIGQRAVIGGRRERMSGFWRSRTGLRGPGSVPPLPGPRLGWGIWFGAWASAAVAAAKRPPATLAASTLRREMLSMLLPCYVQSGMTADGAASVDQRAGKFNSTNSANRAARAPGMTGRDEFHCFSSWPGLSRPSTSFITCSEERRGCPGQARA